MARVACIGTGTVGRAWAVVFARAGYNVSLYDSAPGRVEAALLLIERTLGQLADVGMVEGGAAAAMARVQPCVSMAEAVEGVMYIQESVREDPAIKCAVVSDIAAHAPSDAIIASSTSALPGSSFLTHIPYPERALVVHPVNPPALIPLVEICGTGVTDAATIEQTRDFMVACAMKPVVLKKEIYGFLLNRLQYTLVAEALHLVGEGYCDAEDIDTVMTQGLALRWLTIGPFATAHLNATAGFEGFIEQLEPMMRQIGRDARTDYDWCPDVVARIHRTLAAQMPVAEIAEWQAWRDGRILTNRATQVAGKINQPDGPA
jgi:L-gulonate 3-dehydrogenase